MISRGLGFKMAGALAATLSGAMANAAEKQMYTEMTDNKPEVGVSTTVYLGDRMLTQRAGQYKDCIVPKFGVSKSQNLGMGNFVIKQGEPLCKTTSQSKNYTPNYANWTSSKVSMVLDIALAKKGKEYNICYSSAGFKGGCEKGKTEADFDVGPWFVYQPNTFQQSIEYGGRSGAVLKFTYSEFTDNFARQAFTREFQVDLSQGTVAAYKGAIIEIENATNSSITYKVVRNFQQ